VGEIRNQPATFCCARGVGKRRSSDKRPGAEWPLALQHFLYLTLSPCARGPSLLFGSETARLLPINGSVPVACRSRRGLLRGGPFHSGRTRIGIMRGEPLRNSPATMQLPSATPAQAARMTYSSGNVDLDDSGGDMAQGSINLLEHPQITKHMRLNLSPLRKEGAERHIVYNQRASQSSSYLSTDKLSDKNVPAQRSRTLSQSAKQATQPPPQAWTQGSPQLSPKAAAVSTIRLGG
jgi:hypothetical protein